MSTHKKFVVLALLVLTAAAVDSQAIDTPDQQRPRISFVGSLPEADPAPETKIVGRIIDVRKLPVPHASVQLRNLINGAVQQQSSSDGNGEYQFTVDDEGTYAVEVVLLDGRVVALSNAGALSRFQTLQTVVQLPGRWEGARGMVMPAQFSRFFGMSAATTMTAQTVQMALQQRIQPVDAGEPVSPFKP
jgi:hypothetical protein